MNILENAHEAKKQIMDALEDWGIGIVDSAIKGNPKLVPVGVYIKNGLRNYIRREEERIGQMIDDATLFIADQHGEVNIDKLYNDALSIIKDLEETEFELGFLHGKIGKGLLKVCLPDNQIMRLLMGGHMSFVIDENDFKDLKTMLM